MKSLLTLYNINHLCPICYKTLTPFRDGMSCRTFVKVSKYVNFDIEFYCDPKEVWVALPGVIYKHNIVSAKRQTKSLFVHSKDSIIKQYDLEQPILNLNKLADKAKTYIMFQ